VIGRWKKFFISKGLSPELQAKVDRAAAHLNSAGFDDWGMDPETIKATLVVLQWFYKYYFRVEVIGIDRLPPGRVLLVANHGGQIPIDGMLIAMSLVMDADPPRIGRGMVERFFPTLPFISTLFMRCGQMVGDQHNARALLEGNECVLVFPEGAKGSGKTIFERYQLQKFGNGFLRLALETDSAIVPVAIIGCEETYPGLTSLDPVAKLFGLPYMPVTPFFPLLGVAGMMPLPSKITIRFGEPIKFTGNPDAPDAEIQGYVEQVKASIQSELDEGLAKRGGRIFTGKGG